jgi:hypothetical protein
VFVYLMSTFIKFERRCGRLLPTTHFVCALLLLIAGAGKPASASEQKLPSFLPQVAQHFAMADFDGDSKPDFARVQVGQISSSRYWIDFQLSSGLRQAIGVTAPPGGLRLSPEDVNGDAFPDLIVTTAWLRRPVAVLLNDGHGNFTLREPGGFPASIWESHEICLAASVQVKDSAAALFTRNSSAKCEISGGLTAPQHGDERLAFEACHHPYFSLVLFAFGRAPPACTHRA